MGKIFFFIVGFWCAYLILDSTKPEEVDPVIVIPLAPIPKVDTTRVVFDYDFDRNQWVYADDPRLVRERARHSPHVNSAGTLPLDHPDTIYVGIRRKKDRYEKQMIIDGVHYRLIDRNDGTKLVKIR